MSLLGTQVFANPAKPIWLSSTGGTIEGNVTIDGDIRATGDVGSDGTITMYDPTGATARAELATDNAGTLYIRAPTTINLGQLGPGPFQLPGNTTLTLSAPGANLDNLSVGGTINGIGPVPTQLSVTSPTTITLNALPTTLTVTPYALITGAEYDIQITGYWSVGAGVVTPGTLDYAQVRVEVGSGPSPSFYDKIIDVNVYPGYANNPWTSASIQPFQQRARVKGANIATLTALASFNGTGTYPAGVVDLYITTLDIVRVA